LTELNAALEQRNRFIRETFGRYLSDEIVDTILKKGGLKMRVKNGVLLFSWPICAASPP
jgi:hypothetical protein